MTRDGRQLARQIMDQYATNIELQGDLAAKQDKSDMVNYVTNSALAGELTQYVTAAALSGELNAYVTTVALAGTLQDYATTADLLPLVTQSDLSATLTAYTTTTALDAALTPYLTQSSAEATYSLKNRVVQYETPEVGDTVVVNADTDYLLLDPAGPLANVTLDFPGSPADQKRFTVASTKNMAALSINTGTKTIHNPAGNLSGGGAFEYMYRGPSNAWFRVK